VIENIVESLVENLIKSLIENLIESRSAIEFKSTHQVD